MVLSQISCYGKIERNGKIAKNEKLKKAKFAHSFFIKRLSSKSTHFYLNYTNLPFLKLKSLPHFC